MLTETDISDQDRSSCLKFLKTCYWFEITFLFASIFFCLRKIKQFYPPTLLLNLIRNWILEMPKEFNIIRLERV